MSISNDVSLRLYSPRHAMQTLTGGSERKSSTTTSSYFSSQKRIYQWNRAAASGSKYFSIRAAQTRVHVQCRFREKGRQWINQSWLEFVGTWKRKGGHAIRWYDIANRDSW